MLGSVNGSMSALFLNQHRQFIDLVWPPDLVGGGIVNKVQPVQLWKQLVAI